MTMVPDCFCSCRYVFPTAAFFGDHFFFFGFSRMGSSLFTLRVHSPAQTTCVVVVHLKWSLRRVECCLVLGRRRLWMDSAVDYLGDSLRLLLRLYTIFRSRLGR